jgi:hypothetical protein
LAENDLTGFTWQKRFEVKIRVRKSTEYLFIIIYSFLIGVSFSGVIVTAPSNPEAIGSQSYASNGV